MILWPHILPQYLQVSGYQEQAGDMMLRSSMEAGPQKVRRRFTAAPRPLTGDILVTREQFEFFKYWYEFVLLGGTLRFGWADPWSTTVLTNLITNSGFETGTTGWNVFRCTVASVAGGIYGNCGEMTVDDAPAHDVTQAIYTELSTDIGTVYRATAYAKSGTSGNESCAIEVRRKDTGASYGGAGITTTSSWLSVEYEFTAVTTTTEVLCWKNSATHGTMLFDEVTLYEVISEIVEMRFTEPPTWSSPDGVNIRISMKLEILP